LPDLAKLKQTGGLNNDWDLTAQVIHLLFGLLKTPGTRHHPSCSYDAERIQCYDTKNLADFLNTSASPLMDLWNRYGSSGKDDFVAECYRGDVNTGNIIKRMFQEIYLGPSLFSAIYGTGSEFIGRMA